MVVKTWNLDHFGPFDIFDPFNHLVSQQGLSIYTSLKLNPLAVCISYIHFEHHQITVYADLPSCGLTGTNPDGQIPDIVCIKFRVSWPYYLTDNSIVNITRGYKLIEKYWPDNIISSSD